jgi:hypothetical protein
MNELVSVLRDLEILRKNCTTGPNFPEIELLNVAKQLTSYYVKKGT